MPNTNPNKKVIIKTEAEFNKKFSDKFLAHHVGEQVKTKHGDVGVEKVKAGIGKEIIKLEGISKHDTEKFLKKKGVSKDQIKKFNKAIEKKLSEDDERSIAEKRRIVVKRDESGSELGGSGSTGLSGRKGLSKGGRVRYKVTAKKQAVKSTPQAGGGFASSRTSMQRTTSALNKEGGNDSVVSRPGGGVAKSAGRISTGPTNSAPISINRR
jgi:hypothetical protein